MAYDRFFIAPFTKGKVNNQVPWLLPEDAFEVLLNAMVFRGRVKKRAGTKLMGTGSTSQTAPLLSRLRIDIDVHNANPKFVNLPIPVDEGQQFSIDNDIFTVNNALVGSPLLDTSTTITAQVSGASQIRFDGPFSGSTIFFYPGLPVMGITNFEEGDVNNQPSVAFDTRMAYQFTGGSWDILGPIPPAANSLLFNTTTNTNYVWATNWEGVATDASDTRLFITNFNATIGTPAATDDPIWVYGRSTNWVDFSNSGASVFNSAGDFIYQARIILPFKDRLVLLNTIEQEVGGPTNTAHPNRCRFSFNGTPLTTGAFLEPNQAFLGATGAGGGFIDAPTKEEIVTAGFIKDRLIVEFESSVWELSYTGNQVLPFVWQQLNSELGAIGTFSVIPFDKALLTIGGSGVHACNGSNVERIDDDIPDQIYNINPEPNGYKRVQGIRDYEPELAYWSYPSGEINSINTNKFPDKVLMYNYANATWAEWDDTFTAFGYFYQKQDDIWAGDFQQWQDDDSDWTAGISLQRKRSVLAGNQQGYILIIDREENGNAQAYTITDVGIAGSVITLTVITHNLNPGMYVWVRDLQGITGFTEGIYEVISTPTIDTITLSINDLGGTYEGGGTLTRVSRVDILTKQWNPYIKQGRSWYLAYIDFAVQRTASGQITVDYYPSSSNFSMIENAQSSNTILGTNILETSPYPLVPFEAVMETLWHRVYFQTDGTFIQLRMYYADTQIADLGISLSDFEIQGMILYGKPASPDLE